MSNNNIKSDMGGNPLNIIRIGGAYEQFNIVLCSDLNGCISNLIVGTSNYSLTWNSNYPSYNERYLYYCYSLYHI